MRSTRYFAAAAVAVLAGCQTAPMPPDPTGRASADMLRVLTAFQASGAQPVPKLTVEQRTYPGVTHEFFGMGAVVGQAKQAEDFAAMRLRASFTEPMPGVPAPRGRAARRRAG